MAEREMTALKQAYGLKPSALERLLRGKKDADVVTYCVLPAPAASKGEKRRHQRRRTRLRSGKVLDDRNRFLIDAAILDRSSGGLRLRLARDWPVPEFFHLFDDETQLIFAARVAWRRQALLGALVDPGGPVDATPRQIAALRGKFYAMRD
jgi:hypothetical protein